MLCTVCTESNHYYDDRRHEDFHCRECPSTSFAFGRVVLIVFAAVVLLAAIWWLLRAPPRGMRRIATYTKSSMRRLVRIGLQGKLKMALAFYQVVTTMDSTYGVALPDSYRQTLRAFAVFGSIDWTDFTVPSACLFPHGPVQALLFRCLAPIGCIGGVLLLGVLASAAQACWRRYHPSESPLFLRVFSSVDAESWPPSATAADAAGNDGAAAGDAAGGVAGGVAGGASAVNSEEVRMGVRQIVSRGLLYGMPASILLTFVFVPGVSSQIFRTWSCEEFVVSDQPREVRYFLRDDYSVECDAPGTHETLKRVAIPFILVRSSRTWALSPPAATRRS